VRKAVGILLAVAGALALVWSAHVFSSEAVERDRVRTAWAAEEARLAVSSARSSLLHAASWTPTTGAIIGRLVIPSVGLDEVFLSGVGDRQLAAGPGHLPGSALPGEIGNSVISAHRDKHFRKLGGVEVGDIIVTHTRHRTDTWKVVSRRVVGADEPALFATDDATLTLTTCWPIRFFGSAPDRLLITALLVRPEPTVQSTPVASGAN
jgi:sortase A